VIRRFPDETGLQHQLTLYVRRGCHLCTDMAQALERLRPVYGFDYREVDIDADPKLARRYGTRVPVLAEGATEICDCFLDEQRLTGHLRREGDGRLL